MTSNRQDIPAPTAIARGGLYNALAFAVQLNTDFVRVLSPDGTAELYVNSRRRDNEHPDLMRFDHEPRDPRLAEEADAAARKDDELIERLKGQPGSEGA
ncbi:MAG TPA: hypothetical protein VGS97_09645 [Actinocrinis sp.]|uniref:hypothetical protein n=1 Tax=Actinocrinis sp. TaxID=1920516 RepID=UPI002DDCCF9A|nr:hypothetical protein [Actinocrinis sp.]HEV2344343.1 hypothetical protein [Actinocrinis sp.]